MKPTSWAEMERLIVRLVREKHEALDRAKKAEFEVKRLREELQLGRE